MALDGVMLSVIKDKMEFLVGAKVEEVYQPSKYDLIISMKQGTTQKIIFSCDPERARVQITKNTPENPPQPPMFCMLMRKHLTGGRVKAIRQDGLERVLFFDFDCINELGDNVVLTLCCEIMGRYSNIILVNQNGKVIDAMRRVDASTSAKRIILPGITYEMPPNDNPRFDFITESTEKIISELKNNYPGIELSKALIRTLEGVSPLLTREWSFYVGRGEELSPSEMTEEQTERLAFIINETREKLLKKNYEFTLLRTKEGRMKEFTFMNVSQYGNLFIKKSYDELFEMMDDFYFSYDKSAILKQRANDIFRLLVQNVERTSKRLSVQHAELETCAKKDEYKKAGDLISSYMYMIKKGDKKVIVNDFDEEGSPEAEIKLDTMLSPSENAQKYYKEYRKAVTAEKILAERIRQGEQELVYFDSVLDSLTRAETESDLAQIRTELSEQGYIRKINWKTKPPKALPPMEYTSVDGFKIYVGRNNKQNDKLTLKTAAKTDYWFHTQGVPGSHVIVSAEGKEVPDTTLEQAACLAAYHSKAQSADKVAVDYCLVKYVKKPSDAKPGMVIFTNYKTAYVKPCEIES